MSARIPMHLRLLGSAVALVTVLGTTGCGDSVKVKELQERTAALEAKIKEIEERVPVQYVKPDKDDEYATAVAGTALDSLLAGDVASVRGSLTPKLQKGVEADALPDFFGNKPDAVATWVVKWNPDKLSKSYTIEKVVVSPTKDEIIVQGWLKFVDGTRRGSFSITLVKDKEKNKFLIDAGAAKP
jgi:hypothetical protein